MEMAIKTKIPSALKVMHIRMKITSYYNLYMIDVTIWLVKLGWDIFDASLKLPIW